MRHACAAATVVLLVLTGPGVIVSADLRAATQDAVSDAWTMFLRFDNEAARAAFAQVDTRGGGSLPAVVGGALTRLPHPYDPGAYASGREVLLALGPSREARLARAVTVSDRLWLRLLEAAFASEQPSPGWTELVQAAEALGTTGVWDQRFAVLLASRIVIAAPTTGSASPHAGVTLRLVAALEDLVALAASDVDARHYLIRLYMRRGEPAQARRHARWVLSQNPAPRIAEAALLALTGAGDWSASSDALKSVGGSLPIADSTRQLWQAYVLLQEGRM